MDPIDKPTPQEAFEKWFAQNYPPRCIISKPEWHAPKIWRVAEGLATQQLQTALTESQARCQQLEKDLQEAEQDNDRYCWHCVHPDSGDPERHEHEPNGGHWHHYIDPGDGLPSPCQNSAMLERIFQDQQERIQELERQLQEAQKENSATLDELDAYKRMHAQLGVRLDEELRKSQEKSGRWARDGSVIEELEQENARLRTALASAHEAMKHANHFNMTDAGSELFADAQRLVREALAQTSQATGKEEI